MQFYLKIMKLVILRDAVVFLLNEDLLVERLCAIDIYALTSNHTTAHSSHFLTLDMVNSINE